MNIIKDRLRSVMVLHGDTSQDLSKYLGITETTFSKKLNEKNAEFNLGEIRLIQKKYQLTSEQMHFIFFGKES